MEAAHPALRLVEVRTLIGEALIVYAPGQPFSFDRKPLLACMGTCKEWADAFRPLLWRQCYITHRIAYKMNKELLLKYGHHIRYLILHAADLILEGWFDNCDQLTKIHFEPLLSQRRQIWASPVLQNTLPREYIPDSPSEQDLQFLTVKSVNKFLELIDRNPQLVLLSEYWVHLTTEQMNLFQSSLCQHKNTLVQIHLTRWKTTVKDIQMLIDNSPKLRDFTLCISTLREASSSSSSSSSVGLPATPHQDHGRLLLDLKKIEKCSFSTTLFHGDGSSTIHIHAPELTSCSWSGFKGSTRKDLAPQDRTSFMLCSTWYCPKLQKVRFLSDDGHAMKKVPSMLETAMNIADLSFELCRVEDSVMDFILRRFGSSLRSVKLAGSSGISHEILRRVLCECPNLVFFDGTCEALRASDFSKSRWVCSKLKYLKALLDFSELNTKEEDDFDRELREANVFNRDPWRQKEQERARLTETQALEVYGTIYDQLGSLVELRSICFGGYGNGMKYITGVPWSLKSGLGKLAGLKMLDEIYVTESIREIGLEEAAWMKEHWPRLKRLSRQDDDRSVVTEARVIALKKALKPRVQIVKDRSGEDFPF
ncbi:hypothetical protein BGZ94_010277 [Podila epigama]|nr:hypothetical protein BGZ94_010277 [Podila epigama]